jgi:gamma-glutamylcyclotransferase (GGCT)/AIG2-like uncharacterized protein YtfP
MTTIFVYGTLLFPEIVRALTGKEFSMRDAVLSGYSRYRIDEPGRTLKGPAIVEEAGGTVRGKALLDVDERSLAILDKYEGQYEKKNVVVQCGSEKVYALVYVGTGFSREWLKQEWDEQEFRERYVAWYVNKVIPSKLREWRLEKH